MSPLFSVASFVMKGGGFCASVQFQYISKAERNICFSFYCYLATFPKADLGCPNSWHEAKQRRKKNPKRLTTLYLNVFFFCQDKHMHIATSSIFRNDLFTNLPNETITVFSSAFYWTSLSQRVMTIPAHSCYEFHHSCREWGN